MEFYTDNSNENYFFKGECYQHKIVLKTIKNLLDEVKAIDQSGHVNICDFCEGYKVMNICKCCEILVKRYRVWGNDDIHQEKFNMWLSKVKRFLYKVLEREICQHELFHRDPDEATELAYLLNELKVPLDTRKPRISSFDYTEIAENLTESKTVLDEVLSKLVKHDLSVKVAPYTKIHKKSIDSKSKQYFNVCANGNINKGDECEGERDDLSKKKLTDVNLNGDSSKMRKISKNNTVTLSDKLVKSKNRTAKDDQRIVNERHLKGHTEPIENTTVSKIKIKKRKLKVTPENAMAVKLAKLHKNKNESIQKVPDPVKVSRVPIITKLPVTKHKEPVKLSKDYQTYSESIKECDEKNVNNKKLMKNPEIVRFKEKVPEKHLLLPKVFKSKSDNITSVENSPKTKEKFDARKSRVNIFEYRLSNKEFIERGLTMLPVVKVLRRMILYNMAPAHPQFDWFKNHINERIIEYNTGEKLADIDENGNGRLYYKNGMLALNYYTLQGTTTGYRYVVYSSGEADEFGRSLPVTVLACFDHLGNGVVYDHYGNERLKYNQSEGVVIDVKIGPPARWKWHTLNDPPTYKPVFVDTKVVTDRCFQRFYSAKEGKKLTSCIPDKEPNVEMLAIELESLMKQKNKPRQKFKSFQIKMKALKMNAQFSLKVLDQSNINLIFRDGCTSLKLNLGLLLKSDEILGTCMAEVSEVPTTYDSRPPESQSVSDLQKLVVKAKKLGRSHFKSR